MRARYLAATAVLVGILAMAAPIAGQAPDLAEVQVQMAEARRHFEALEYEQAVPALDRTIAILSARRTEETRKFLADAYEMRARSRYGLGDQNGAREDFVNLLRTDATRLLSGQVSPRIVTMFEEAQKATITTVRLVVIPETAEVKLDGMTVKANAQIPIAVGEHTMTATQLGYRPGSATFTAVVGAASEASLELPRTAAVASIVTSPADVEVFVNGVSRGKTKAGPPPAEFAERAQKAGTPMASLSAVLTLADLPAGTHRIEFRRDCYVRTERRLEVNQLQDFILDPVKLESAISTVVATSNQPNTTVFVDGEERGPAPYTAELCEGQHTVELRSPYGRYARRLETRPGEKANVAGVLRPAFAIVSASAQGPLSTDLRAAVERALEPVRSVFVFAPPADRVEQVIKASKLPPDWLSFDANKRALGVSGDISGPMRRELSATIAKAFGAQGVASVTIPSALSRNRVVVSLLGAGSAEPDVVELSLDRQDTIADAVALLDRPVPLLRPSIGINVIDVADVAGAVVFSIAPGSAAASVSIQPGDTIVKANDQAIPSASALASLLASRGANDTLSLEVKDRAGASKTASVKVAMTPRLVGISDQMLLANRLLADFRNRLLAPANATEEAIIRLNMAAAMVRLQEWSEARNELQNVKLPEQAGVGNGTVQYLLGLCFDNLGNRAEAETAWRAAASSESWLTEDGPPVKELAEARLAEMQRRPAR